MAGNGKPVGFVPYLLDEVQRRRICRQYKGLTLGGQEQVLHAGFAASGTNPDALLAIELQQDAAGQVWRFGLARMTIFQVIVKLDEKQVWRVPFVPWQGTERPSKFDTWLFFHESLVNEAIQGR